jgi:hypothetical protein
MTDDLMRRVAAARPGHLDPDAPLDGRTRSPELTQAMTATREACGTRRSVRPIWGLGLVGIGAAAALVVAISAIGPSDDQPDPANGNATAATGTNGTGTTGTGTNGTGTRAPGTGTTLNARAVLLAAADGADRQPAQTGAWWHTVSLQRTYVRVTAPTGPYVVALREREEGWTPSAVRKQQWSRAQDLGAVPATPADQAAWQRAGSPQRIPAKLPVVAGSDTSTGAGAKRLIVTMTPRAPQTSHQPLVDGDKVFWLGRNVTMKDLRGLPDSPQGLKRRLLRSYDGHSTESATEKMSANDWLFQVSAGLITTMPVTPKVRGAAFRMLAGLGTVTATANVTDAEGRTGTAVTITDHNKFGVQQRRLIIDTARGRALADETVVVAPGATTPAPSPGAGWTSSTVLTAEWTNLAPR